MPDLVHTDSAERIAVTGTADCDIITPPSRRRSASDRPIVVSLLTDSDRETWDRYVRGHEQGTLFHTTAWHDAVSRSFGHEAYYLLAKSDNAIVGVLPAFFVASRILGRMLVSVPYGVGGGVLAADARIARTLLDRLTSIGAERSCGFIDLRSAHATFPELPVVDRYAGFERVLPEQAEDVLAWLPRKARAAARNARTKYGLSVEFGEEHLPTVWRLYTRSMRRLASLNYPLHFFESLAACFPKHHWVCVVRRGGKPVAGLMTFLYQNRVLPYFFGATETVRRCGAGNLIYLSVMERAVAAGYRVFDFGRSRRDNAGSFNFKRFCGFEPRPLEYQYLCAPGTRPPDTSPTSARYALARRAWPLLPLAVTQRLGAWLTKHIPG